MKQFFVEMFQRFVSWKDTPAFFRKIQAIGGAMVAMAMTMNAFKGLPVSLTNQVAHIAFIGATMVAVAQLACNNPPQSK